MEKIFQICRPITVQKIRRLANLTARPNRSISPKKRVRNLDNLLRSRRIRNGQIRNELILNRFQQQQQIDRRQRRLNKVIFRLSFKFENSFFDNVRICKKVQFG